MPPQPIPPLPPRPEQFRPENFQQKHRVRDYVIYGLLLGIVGGLAGGAAYYYSRSPVERAGLRGKAKHYLGKAGLDEPAKPMAVKLPPPKLDGLLEPETNPAAAPAPAAPQPVANVSAYAGGRPTRVLPSTDPKLPRASAGFIAFAESLKVNGVFQGNPAKVLLGEHLFLAGDVINPELGVTLVGVDGEQKVYVLRDKTGAELRVTY